MHDTAKAIDALHAIPPDLPRDEWVRAGMAAQAAGLDFDTFNDWSAGAANYDARAAADIQHAPLSVRVLDVGDQRRKDAVPASAKAGRQARVEEFREWIRRVHRLPPSAGRSAVNSVRNPCVSSKRWRTSLSTY